MRKLFLIVLNLLVWSSLMSLAKGSPVETRRAWIGASDGMHTVVDLFNDYSKTKDKKKYSLLIDSIGRVDKCLGKLVTMGELERTEVNYALSSIEAKKQELFRAFTSQLQVDYGHSLAMKMMGRGVDFFMKAKSSQQNRAKCNVYLPKQKMLIFKQIIGDVPANKIKLKSSKYISRNGWRDYQWWMYLNGSLAEYAFYSNHRTYKSSHEKLTSLQSLAVASSSVMDELLKKKMMYKKTYNISFDNLPQQVRKKLERYIVKLVPEYGSYTAQKMLGKSIVDQFFLLIAPDKHNKNQFSVYLPSPYFGEVTSLIENALK